MKTFWFLTLAFGVVTVAETHAEIIAVEDFSGGSPTWVNDIAKQQFVDPDSPTEGLFIRAASSDHPRFNGQSAFARDLKGEKNEPSLDPFKFTFNEVDISAHRGVTLGFDFVGRELFGQRGVYIVVIDGVDQPGVVLYDGVDVVSSPLVPIADTASSVGLRLEGVLNGSLKTLEFDNFQVVGELELIPEPSGLALATLAGTFLLRRDPRG